MRWLPLDFADEILPGGYAVLGAAAMAAGVTRTISSAILVFELTGGLTHVLPLLLAVMVAYITAEGYSVSIFDSILSAKGLITMFEFKEPQHRAHAHCPIGTATAPPPGLVGLDSPGSRLR